MHNFATLAADLAPFFQKRGDTGDRSSNHLNVHDFAVTTRRGRVSPVDLRVVTDPNRVVTQEASNPSRLIGVSPLSPLVLKRVQQMRCQTIAPGNGRQFGKS
jgi:hypothetical protein